MWSPKSFSRTSFSPRSWRFPVYAAVLRLERSPYVRAWRTRDTLWHASPTVGYLAIGRRLARRL